MASNANHDQTRSLDTEQIQDLKNARGCGVSWARLATFYGMSVDDLQQLSGYPQFKAVETPDRRKTLFDDRGEA